MPVESHPNAAKSANVRVGAPRGHWSSCVAHPFNATSKTSLAPMPDGPRLASTERMRKPGARPRRVPRATSLRAP